MCQPSLVQAGGKSNSEESPTTIDTQGRGLSGLEIDKPLRVGLRRREANKAIGEDHILFASDVPHNEGRENAAKEILGRRDLSPSQKRKFLYDNTVGFFGEP